MKNIIFLICFFAICSGIAGGQTNPMPTIINTASAVQSPEKTQKTSFSDLVGLKGKNAPQFILPAMDGTEYNLENLRGKIVVINLWGTFCSPCIQEMPELNTLAGKYKDKEVVFLAPAPDDKTDLEAFLQKHPFDYQILPNGFAVIEKYAPHQKSDGPQKSGGFMMLLPTHLIIDQSGTVTYHNWGYSKNTVADLTNEIEILLAKTK